MDGRGGACITRYSGVGSGFGELTYGMSKVDRIMLKFRPIAPKPMAAGSSSSSSTADQNNRTRRRKRKYVRVNANKNNKKIKTTTSTSKKGKEKQVSTSASESSGAGEVVTLSLMPETPDRKENSPAPSSPSENRNHSNNKPSPVLLSFNNLQYSARDGHVIKPTPVVITSLVTVECVTETWMSTTNGGDGGGVGFVTDEARVMSMEMDTCPSFVTNGRDTVVWTNKAYREMITGGGFEEMAAVVVVRKVNRVAMPVSHVAFTCKVKVTWGAEGATMPGSVTAPCDVWRMRSGGYAWRLDVKAALCLGRYS